MGQCLCLRARLIEQPAVNLPWELEEEILSRLPPQSLVRFKTVCKRWNALSNDKSFLTNHLSHSRPQFIFQTNTKAFAIDIITSNSMDPTIESRELPSSHTPYQDTMYYIPPTTCDEFLFCNYFCKEGTALWNPWLRQVKWIQCEPFYICGLGYDNSSPEKVYKILGLFFSYPRVTIYDCATNTFKFIDKPDDNFPLRPSVPLNGNLYWVTRNDETGEYIIQSFDFSRECFKPFCLLPCQKKHICDQLILAAYKGDRFSVLKQCYETGKIEIWVTKKSIDRENEKAVWINMMTFPTTNLPRLFAKSHISYFIYDKTIFMCCDEDKALVACIYIVRKDLFKKYQIGSGIFYRCHCVYTPNLISLPLF